MGFTGETNDKETPNATPLGLTSSGLHGIHRVAVPYAPYKHITLSGQGGYGLTESLGPVTGAHHRLVGKLAAGFSPLNWIGFGLSLDGYYDNHPSDDDGDDSTIIGNPRLTLRFGYALNKTVQIGADFELWIPGAKAPSLDWDATTLDSRLLLALSPVGDFWTVAAAVGFRMDNSANSAPDPDSLRPGDRISLGVSEFHAALLGIGSSLRFSSFELLLEFTANLLVGGHAPTSSSPFRFGVGGRYHLTDALSLELLTETLAGGRPAMGTDAPLVPVEPRFSLLAGLRYAFILGKEPPPPPPAPPEPPVVETPPPVEEPEVILVTVSGTVEDSEGNPIGGADVRLNVGETEHTTKTGSRGEYAISDVPPGTGTITVTTDGFEDDSREITVAKDMPAIEPHILNETEETEASQLRGIIRSFKGKPLEATIIIDPVGLEVETDGEGYFTQDLPPGKYTVTIKARGYKHQHRKVEIEENSVTIINADLRRRK